MVTSSSVCKQCSIYVSVSVHVLLDGDPRWSCEPEHPGGDGSASEPSVECVQTTQGDEISEPPGATIQCTWSDVRDVSGGFTEMRGCNDDSMDSLTETLSKCQEQLCLAEKRLDERCEPLKKCPGRHHP